MAQSTTKLTLLLLACAVALTPLCSAAESLPLKTVAKVDLSRYLGVWHEIARYPNRFQSDCNGSSAVYSLRPDGDILVTNRCRDKETGQAKESTGHAWVVDKESNARLKVSFFWPFRGDYWIIDLGSNYEYAVVGTPNRKYLWILSRTPVLGEAVYIGILKRIEQQGFNPALLMKSGV
jgi:apolipoprotein D and lipocalin family protein